MFLVWKLFVKLIKHTQKYDTYRYPLPLVDVMAKVEDTSNYSNHFSCCWNHWEHMLLEVSNNIVDTNLTNNLKDWGQEEVT